jgi:UDPglucose 6-dehydrogenase
MNICVVGSGYVGLVTGACFAEFGLKVTCVDNDEKKIADLKQGVIPIYEPGLEEMIKKNVKEGHISFTSNLAEAVQKALVVFIAVGTPPRDDGSADLSYVEKVAESIAQNMNGYKVVVTKSTVPVGTGEKIRAIISQSQREKVDFDIVSNPEFLREGSAIEDFMHPNRVVVGADSDQAMAIMKDLYSPLYLVETPFVLTNVATAEMIKYASNAFLATKISFINEIANICELVRADVHKVAVGMGLDNRIGSKFLHPGPGFGGSCFPKDTQAIVQIAREHGYDFKIVQAVLDVNHAQRMKMVDKIRGVLNGNLAGKTIAVLGLSFKPNTDDMRDAPSVDIIQALQKEGASIRAYDPVAVEEAKKFLPDITYCDGSYSCAEGADALVFMTEWNQFRILDLQKLKHSMKSPIVIDLRNVYEPSKMRAEGFRYACVGRH